MSDNRPAVSVGTTSLTIVVTCLGHEKYEARIQGRMDVYTAHTASASVGGVALGYPQLFRINPLSPPNAIWLGKEIILNPTKYNVTFEWCNPPRD